jgi:hypothetical protein
VPSRPGHCPSRADHSRRRRSVTYTAQSDRIALLLVDLDACQADLAEAVTAAQADDARALAKSIRHSLWLAGYRSETEDA